MRPVLRVQSPGPHATLQDLGRIGYQEFGVPVSGALDGVSLRLANRLVGNAEGAAALELLFQGPSLEVAAESLRVALAGTETALEVLGERPRVIPPWHSVRLRCGETFRIGALRGAACAYLAVAGGFAVEPWLGSLSTYARGGLGGFGGRPLRAGDELPLALDEAPEGGELRLTPPDLRPPARVRVVLGPQAGHFTPESVALFLETTYRVSPDADRMGLRLDGPRLSHADGYNIVSDGIVTGAIQVPGSGQPILLLADHQTTGGYPKIAAVISADLPAVGRLKPGDPIAFSAVAVAEAERHRRDQEAWLRDLAERMEPAAEPATLDLRSLYERNLVSGVVSGFE